MSQENVERVRRSVEGSVEAPLGSLNYDLLPHLYHEDMEFRESVDLAASGVYKGLSAYEGYWRQFTEHVTDYDATVEQAFDGGDKVLAYMTFHGRAKETGERVEINMAAIFTFKGDKISLVEGFRDRAHAHEAFRRPTG